MTRKGRFNVTSINPEGRVRLHVQFKDGRDETFTVSPIKGWRVDYSTRMIFVSTGMGLGDRMVIPFDNVLYWRVDTTERTGDVPSE